MKHSDRGATGAGEVTRSRFVVLGASNVSRGLTVLFDRLRVVAGTPIELFAAAGRGRSYGLESRFLIRGLPSILDSGLWSALSSVPVPGSRHAPCRVLVTDIGNDLLYGASAAQTASWVEAAIERLPVGSEVVLTLPPQRLQEVPEALLRVARTVFFPGRRADVPALLRQVEELTERLEAFANRVCVTTIASKADWYSLDPIHYPLHRRSAVFEQLTEPWCHQRDLGDGALGPDLPATDWISLQRARPARYTIAGRSKSMQQPAATLSDRSRLWMY